MGTTVDHSLDVVDVVVRTATSTSDVTIARHPPDATLGALVARCGGHSTVVYVDGRPWPASTPIDAARVVVGSTIATASDQTGAAAPAPSLDLVTLAGPGSGTRTPLGPGRYRLGPGRRGRVDEAVVELDVRLDGSVLVVAAASADDVRLDGSRPVRPTRWRQQVLAVDGRAFAVRERPPPLPRLVSHDGGRVPFNRPPRRAGPPAPPPLEIPPAARLPGDRRRFPLLALVAPLPVALGMAALLGDWRYLLFGLLSPVMLLANWVEDVRHRRGERRAASRADRAATEALRTAVGARHTADLAVARRRQPSLPELLDTVEAVRPTLWERRPGDGDALHLTVGLADRPWTPERELPTNPLPAAEAVLREAGPLPCVPVVIDLATERGIAVVGDVDRARAIARAVVIEATTLHGPADLDLVVCAAPGAADAWEWVKWLPHARRGGRVMLLTQRTAAGSWAADAATGSAGARVTLVVADGSEWWHGRRAPLQPLVAGPSPAVRLLVRTDEEQRVPATCTTVVAIGPLSGRSDSTAVTVDRVAQRSRTADVAPLELTLAAATRAAQAMASLEDTACDSGDTTAALPPRVTILDALTLDDVSGSAIEARWSDPARDGSIRVPIGHGVHGTVHLDLVTDGPHALVAGTTGAGKSELLRSLIVSWAATVPPDELNVVLVDFKGGAAFDACAHLPHTVGLVTDLDEQLAGRMLRCLRAELTHRERLLRDAGASSLEEYRRQGAHRTLPRLVLVVDEFALLAAEFPDFMPALVDIAQRGRSLGFHMVLATQRPAGVVDHRVRANTNLRIALRVQDDGDSIDVVGCRDAAALPRDRPGRAFVRRGAGDLVTLQTAWSTGPLVDAHAAGLVLRPFLATRAPTSVEAALDAPTDAADAPGSVAPGTELEALVTAIEAAAAVAGQVRQRHPCPDPLPHEVGLADLLSAAEPAAGVPFALVDRPDEQRRDIRRFVPGRAGSLLVVGLAGSGTSSTLVTLALGTATMYAPDDAHLYAIDADAGLLGPLAGLAHCGGVAGLDDLPRIARIAHHLAHEVGRRRQLAARLGSPEQVIATEPSITLLVDNVGALRHALDGDRACDDVWPALELVVRDGRAVGIGTVLTASHERAVPAAVAAQMPSRLLLQLGDRLAYSSFGVRPADVPAMAPGRALVADGALEVQIARPPIDLAGAVADLAGGTVARPPVAIGTLPDHVDIDLTAAVRTATGVRVPIGLDLRTATDRTLDLDLGSSLLVLGPARSGRSSLLLAIAQAVAAADPRIARFAVAPRPTALGSTDLARSAHLPAEVATWVDAIAASTGPTVVFVDDADRLDGPNFERLAAIGRDDVAFVVAGVPDPLGSLAHWSRPLLRTRSGVLLRPSPVDGDLLRVQLPPRLGRSAVGHGLLVDDGELAPVLVARPAGAGTSHLRR